MYLSSEGEDTDDGKAVERDQEPLKTRIYCQLTNGKVPYLGDPSMLSVVELIASERSAERRLPLRYVLVIDVSGSMGEEIGGGPQSLLDRVKVFAELVIKVITKEDSLALVTFSNEAEVQLPMTQMTDWAKDNARAIVKVLKPQQSTNLESGLMKGLEVIEKNPGYESRDCIILFTDGETNTGEQDPDTIVKNFRTAHEKLDRKTCVPVSAFTIGTYIPSLLAELADLLGSEAFYWLSEEEDFESDMLLPVFLRETTQITDVTVELTCLLNFTFDVDCLLVKHLKKSSLTQLEYFIHSIPAGIKKHIPLTIIPPEGDLKSFDQKRIVEVKVEYIDLYSRRCVLINYIIFSWESIRECRTKIRREKGVKHSEASDGMSAYTISGGQLETSWAAAQDALTMVVNEDCRMLTMREMDIILCHILDDGDRVEVSSFKEAINGVNEIKQSYRDVFGHRNQCTARIDACADSWIEILNFGKSIANPYNYGRIAALHSSIAAEMPVPKGVFQDSHKQMYMPRRVRRKMRQYERALKKSKNETKNKDEIFGRSRVFVDKTLIISESLRTYKYGAKQESLAELIVKHGGRPEYVVILNPYKEAPEWYVPKTYQDTVLVCSKRDFDKLSLTVRDAQKARIPIVREGFVFDCMRKKKFLMIKSYFFNGPPK